MDILFDFKTILNEYRNILLPFLTDKELIKMADYRMADYRNGYIQWQGRDHKVTWHPVSKEVYVWKGSDKYCGKAYDMKDALAIALSWLNIHAQ